MIDVHDQDDGAVYSDCKCSPGDPVPTGSVPLPAWCYSPDGKTCSWYRECLNKAYPQCENGADNYAIKFAEKFCKLYDESYSNFSPQGQRWIDAVRKCLQLKLVPLVDKTRDKTCAELKSTAFNSHSPCYVKPDESSPSVCDLSVDDWQKVFWTIESALYNEKLASLEGFIDVSIGCAKRTVVWRSVAWAGKKILAPFKYVFNLEIDTLPKFFGRRKRALEDDKEIARSKFARKVLDDLALKENWKEKGVAWFGYANNETGREENTMSIRLLLADRYKYVVDNTSLSKNKTANLTTALAELSEAVLMGTLNLTVDGESIKIMKLVGCLDWDCQKHTFNVTALKLQENNETESNETIRNETVSNNTVSNETVNNGTARNGAVMYGAMYTLLLPSLVINILFILIS